MKTVFFDVDTQIDFLYPAGALYVPGAEKQVAAYARLNRWAAEHGVPVVSTTDAHTENDPEFIAWPAHCVAGTTGQQKPQATLLERRAAIPNTPDPFDISGAQQIALEKQALDCFTNVHIRELLDRLDAERYVVYGVVTEYCVKCAAFGLLGTGKPVAIVTDAVKSLSDEDSRRTLEEFTARGGTMTTVAEVCV